LQYKRCLTTDPRTEGAEDKKARKITKKNKFTAKTLRALPGLENAEDEKEKLKCRVKGERHWTRIYADPVNPVK
jgi:hypothetical protein